MFSRPHRKALRSTIRRFRALATGRHHLYLHPAPTVTGYWAWSTHCITCGLNRSSIETTQTEALHKAHALIGPRDHHTLNDNGYLKKTHFSQQLTEAGHPPLYNWTGLSHLTLPPTLAGDGYTVATDGSCNPTANRAAWAFVTNTGWCNSGPLEESSKIDSHAAELSAVRHALKIYPRGSTVTLLIDNVQVGILIQDLVELADAGRKLNGRRLPNWADPTITGNIKGFIHNLNSLTVLWRRTTTDPLHNLADTLARAANGTRAKKAIWKPADVEPIEGHCAPICTWTSNHTPAARCA